MKLLNVLILLWQAQEFSVNGFITTSSSRRLVSSHHISNGLISNALKSADHSSYLSTIALVDPPSKIELLFDLLQLNGEEIVQPRKRAELNPFLIPISKRTSDNSFLCYIRWPTQKPGMDLQVVRTTSTGIKLVAMGTDQLCKRLVVEMDFYAHSHADEAIALINKDSKVYTKGDYIPLIKSGKFPALTKEDLKLFLDRYILTKVGAFPDCYEALSEDYVKRSDVTSGLITCERAVSVFYGWGHPMGVHAKLLSKLGRDKEARDTARAALSNPLWTIADEIKVLFFYI